jgi:hypothetical protein
MTDLEQLAAFPATGEPGLVINDWEHTEAELGVILPAGFMRFVDVFGGAKFDDFLHVHRAGARNPHLDLVTQTYKERKAVATARPHIHELLAERGTTTDDLICWGGTDNADMCFLIPHADPRRWAVLTVIGRGNEYDLWEGQPDSYLLHVLRRDYISDVFPDDFPDENPSYERRPHI